MGNKQFVFLVVTALVIGCGKKSPTIETPTENKPNPNAHDFDWLFLDAGNMLKVPVPAGSFSSLKFSACPSDMVEIEGEYCPNVEKVCLHWVDLHGVESKAAIPMDDESGRCGEWKRGKCLSKKLEHRHFCIDAYEFPNIKGQRPRSWMSWFDAKHELEAIGKRMCMKSEWTFAMQGPDMHFYPYGDGYHRDNTACNFDNPLPKGTDVFKARHKGDPTALVLDEMLVPAGSMPRCMSDWGVFDGSGNIDEWIVSEAGEGNRISGLVGGHIFGVRNNSMAMTFGHGPEFVWYETGTRGCKDIIEGNHRE